MIMKVSKFYQISTLLLLFLLISFSNLEAAHFQAETIQPTKKEVRKSLKKNKEIVKNYIHNLIPKKLKKENRSNGDNLLSSVLALAFGLISGFALIAAFYAFISTAAAAVSGFLVLAIVAAILGIVFFVVSLIKTKKGENTGGLVMSIIGVISSISSGLFAGIIAFFRT
jgi:uncharacterized membrane protein